MNGTRAWASTALRSTIFAVADLPQSVLKLSGHRIVFVGGKGGVGKTTVAAALAIVAADRDRRCLVVSTDPAHSLGDILGRTIGDTETALAPNLVGLEIDPDAEAERHVGAVKHQMKLLVHPRLSIQHITDRQYQQIIARCEPELAARSPLIPAFT